MKPGDKIIASHNGVEARIGPVEITRITGKFVYAKDGDGDDCWKYDRNEWGFRIVEKSEKDFI